jgi:hypothetical protein
MYVQGYLQGSENGRVVTIDQCPSTLMLWVWILLKRDVHNTTLYDKVCQWLAAGRSSSPGPPISFTWPPRYNLNIVESGVKHHKPYPYLFYKDKAKRDNLRRNNLYSLKRTISKARTLIFNVTCHGMFRVQWFKAKDVKIPVKIQESPLLLNWRYHMCAITLKKSSQWAPVLRPQTR